VAVELTPAPTLRRQYPHLEGVSDWRAAQSLRLLWDRYYDLEARLQGIEATAGDLVSAANTTEDQLTRVDHKADEALALAQLVKAQAGEGGDGGGPLPAGGDGGEGAAGFAAAGITGDITVTDHNAYNAGLIVGGTDQEWAALLAVTVDQPTRDANIQELRDRILWHLEQAGYTCGLQKNPSGLIAMGKIAVICDGITRAYDVLRINDYTVPVETRMLEVGGPQMQPATPIPD
jgi:hypothetical protein